MVGLWHIGAWSSLTSTLNSLQVFGIPRFSSRVLFLGDPGPWTDGKTGRKVVYSIANAQLPDPSWEWVHPEWYVDMSGPTDESGWQYSGDFGEKYVRAARNLPKVAGLSAAGNTRAERHMQKKAERQERREQKRKLKEDEGFEALKRTALARREKWSESSDPWTFVRRRRWIRLRRRKPVFVKKAEARSAEPTPADEKARRDMAEAEERSGTSSDDNSSMDDSTGTSTSSDTDEDEEEGEEEDEARSIVDPLRRRASDVSPGTTPRGNPLEQRRKDRKLRKQRARATDFNDTVRELKALIPIILDPRKAKQHLRGNIVAPAQEELDARNPFLSWRLVKRRLEETDLTWESSSLRTRDRRFVMRQERRARAKAQKGGGGLHIQTQLMPRGTQFGTPMQSPMTPKTAAEALEEAVEANEQIDRERQERVEEVDIGDQTVIVAPPGDAPAQQHQPAEDRPLTRDALVEINFQRATRVLRACKIDRQKLELWRLWLGVDRNTATGGSIGGIAGEEAILEDLRVLGLAALGRGGGGASDSEAALLAKRARALRRFRAMQVAPDAMDVWDVLERRLDQLLLLFEFQSSRVALIKLLWQQHPTSHAQHVVKATRRDSTTLLAIPSEIAPWHRHAASPGGESSPGRHVVEAQPWREAALPRLQFWSDLYGVVAHPQAQSSAQQQQQQNAFTSSSVPPRSQSTQPAPTIASSLTFATPRIPNNAVSGDERPVRRGSRAPLQQQLQQQRQIQQEMERLEQEQAGRGESITRPYSTPFS